MVSTVARARRHPPKRAIVRGAPSNHGDWRSPVTNRVNAATRVAVMGRAALTRRCLPRGDQERHHRCNRRTHKRVQCVSTPSLFRRVRVPTRQGPRAEAIRRGPCLWLKAPGRVGGQGLVIADEKAPRLAAVGSLLMTEGTFPPRRPLIGMSTPDLSARGHSRQGWRSFCEQIRAHNRASCYPPGENQFRIVRIESEKR